MKIKYCHYTKCCSRQKRCLSTQKRRFDLKSYPRSDEHALAGRDPKHDLVLENSRVHFTNFSEGVKVNDLQTGENRTPVKKDLVDSARVIDYLDEVDFCEKALGAHDVSQKTVPLHNAEAYLTNTTKHCAFGPGNGKLLNKILEMAAVIVGGFKKLKERPIVSFATCPVSPLKLITDCCEIIMESAKNNVVCNILSMAMSGGTAPVSTAGTLVIHNAEILSGITLSQFPKGSTCDLWQFNHRYGS